MKLYFQEHHHRTCFALDACVLEVWPFWREKLPSAGPIERRCRGFWREQMRPPYDTVSYCIYMWLYRIDRFFSWQVRQDKPVCVCVMYIDVYWCLYWFITIYNDLYWFILIYMDLYWFILIYIDLYWFILIYIDLFIYTYIYILIYIDLYSFILMFILIEIVLYCFILIYIDLHCFLLNYIDLWFKCILNMCAMIVWQSLQARLWRYCATAAIVLSQVAAATSSDCQCRRPQASEDTEAFAVQVLQVLRPGCLCGLNASTSHSIEGANMCTLRYTPWGWLWDTEPFDIFWHPV